VVLKLALDAFVAPEPWYVVTFAAVLVATWLGGPATGVIATLGIVAVDLAVLSRPAMDVRGRAVATAVEIVAGLGAVAMGTVIRTTRVREEASIVSATEANRTSADTDRRWHTVTEAIGEFASIATPLQVEDALIRRASELVGRRVAFDRSGSGSPVTAGAGPDSSVPVAAEGAVYGRLRLASAATTDTGDLVPEDRIGLAVLARLAAAALDRIRLLADSGRSVRFAERSGQRLQRLQTLTSQLAALVTPESIGEVVVGHTLAALGAPVGLFYLTDSAGELRLAHARGYPIGLAGHDARVGPGDRLPAADSLRDGQPVIIPTPAEWRVRYPGSSDRLAITGTRSVIAWPIGTPPQAILVVQRTSEGIPTDDELGLLEVVGHQATQAIERARIYAQEREARQLQEAFVGIMSHELRTPITTILAGSKLLSRDRGLRGGGKELALDIEAEADRLFRLVEDLLVLSRLERGSLSVGDEPVHLVRVLQRVVASETPRWPSTRFELPSERAGALVRGDETYVEQVVRNLLTNAAKYSPAGSTVRVELERRDSEVTVRVLDEGGGVSDAEVERLFSLFYRSPTTAASAAGAGIGLFVCRRLVGAMGGRIWARGRPEGGSEFGFSLAIYPDDEPDRVASAPDGTAEPTRGDATLAGVAARNAESGDNGESTRGDRR
jgi:signal transduction histidine kinase